MSTSTEPTPCDGPATGRCQRYHPGHNTHWIHAKHVGRSPWGWRDGVVTALSGQHLTVRYLVEDAEVRLWHHEDLSGEVTVGAPVRVHERLHVLGGPFGWLNVTVDGGLGAVPEPAEPALWADQVTSGVQDLSTGRALALDRPTILDE
jgi:hypothetical protein